MQIILQNLGKRFNRQWIFRSLNYAFEGGNAYAITGPNGSGKSTLLQVIAGSIQHSEGNIIFTVNGKTLDTENHYEQVSIAAPYLELIEELTLTEFLEFHQQFKPFIAGYNIQDIISYIDLKNAANKQLRYFSSGMKQRVKLAQAFFSNTTVLILDEPTANLDAAGISLYNQLINNFTKNKIVIIGSNDEHEISFCQNRLLITDFKTL